MSFVDAPACIRFIVQVLSLEATVACKPKLPFDIAFMITKGHESRITLVVAQEAVVNLKLEVGSVGEQVTSDLHGFSVQSIGGSDSRHDDKLAADSIRTEAELLIAAGPVG